MTATKIHPLQSIAESGAKPMQKVEKLRTGNSEAITAGIWAQQAIALCIGQASAWSGLVQDLFGMNTEQREAAIKTWRAWRTEKTKAFNAGEETTPAMDEKTFKRIMSTAAVRISHMSTIAKALDSGMDVGTLATHYKVGVDEVKNMSIDTVYNLAKSFTGSKTGRKADPFLESLRKFLEKKEDGLEASDIDAYNAVVKFVNELK